MGTRLTEQPRGKSSQTRNQRMCYNNFFIFSQIIFLGSVSQWKKISFKGNIYPDWAQAAAWCLALLSFVAIPIGAIYEIFHPKGSFREV